jgi:hypothetical protein
MKLRIVGTSSVAQESSPEQADLGDKVVIGWVVKKTTYFGHGSPIDRATGEYMVREMNSKHPDMHHWVEPANRLPFACNDSPLP